MSNSNTDRQLIVAALLEALNTTSFLKMDELVNASKERLEEFIAVKRQVRNELQKLLFEPEPETEKPKAKKKPFSTARYKTHDGEKGSPEQWREAAKVLLNVNDENCLTTLGLTGVPASEDDLKKAWRAAIRKCHPDIIGGSQDEAAKLNAAYELALSLFFTKKPMTATTKGKRKDTKFPRNKRRCVERGMYDEAT